MVSLIVTDSVKNVNALLRRQNETGTPVYGKEAVTLLTLAWELIMEEESRNGLSELRLINDSTAAGLISELLSEQPALLSFIPEQSRGLAASREVLASVNLLRGNPCADLEEPRIRELKSFIERYEQMLRDRHRFDTVLALKEAKRILEEKPEKQGCRKLETCYFRAPSELERSLVRLFSGQEPEKFGIPASDHQPCRFVRCYGIVNEAEYIAKQIAEKKYPFCDVEVLCKTELYTPYIEETFAKYGIPCRFASALPAVRLDTVRLYKDLLFWYKNGCHYKDLFPVAFNPRFRIRVSEKSVSAGSLFLKGISWQIGWGKDRYETLRRSSCDQEQTGDREEAERPFRETGSSAPASQTAASSQTDAALRQFREAELPALGKLADEIREAASPAEVFRLLHRYVTGHTVPRNPENRLLAGPLSAFGKMLAETAAFAMEETDRLEYLEKELDNLTFSDGTQEPAVLIEDIASPQVIERSHLFVPGLSAKEFAPETAESPVLGDDLRKRLYGTGAQNGSVRLAEQAVEEAEKLLRGTLGTVPEGGEIILLCSSADVLRDGSEVAPSAFFEKLAEEKKAEILEEPAYYHISAPDRSLQIDREAAWPEMEPETEGIPEVIGLTFSKTSLDTLLACPLKYHYEKELYINQEEYAEYDPGRWLAPNEKGTFVHAVLEKYIRAALMGRKSSEIPEAFDENSEVFEKAVKEAAEEAESRNAAPNGTVREKETEECRKMAAAYLPELHRELREEGWEVISCEEEIGNGAALQREFQQNGQNFHITFTGKIDRIDRKQTGDGYIYRISDYKTGTFKKRKKLLDGTKQQDIYAAYVEQKYGRVESFHYLYLDAHSKKQDNWRTEIRREDFCSEILRCEANGEKISDRELLFRVFRGKDYRCVKKDPASEACRYCRYQEICLWELADDRETEDAAMAARKTEDRCEPAGGGETEDAMMAAQKTENTGGETENTGRESDRAQEQERRQG